MPSFDMDARQSLSKRKAPPSVHPRTQAVPASSLSAQDVLLLQRTAGNQAVSRLLTPYATSVPARMVQRLPAAGLIHRAFTHQKMNNTFTSERGEVFNLVEDDPVDYAGQEAWKLQSRTSGDIVYINRDTKELIATPSTTTGVSQSTPKTDTPPKQNKRSVDDIIPTLLDEEDITTLDEEATTEPAKKKQRLTLLDEYLSDFSEHESDGEKVLNSEQKLKILQAKGKRKKKALLTKMVPKTAKVFQLDDPHARKVYSAHRTDSKTLVSDPKAQEYFKIGQQTLRMGEGTGHFVQAGGNSTSRSNDIKEPPADYGGVITELRKLGNDPNTAALYELATGQERLASTSNAKLTDSEIAAMLLYYMNHNAQTIEDQLEQRSQLTECCSKFVAITMIAEHSRSMEGNQPYDATLLVKQCLMKALGGTSLIDLFAKGTNGSESIFLGAPSGKDETIGGAEQLRNPLDYQEALDRQMDIFPDNAKAFKHALNSLRTASTAALSSFTPPTEEERKQFFKQQQADEVANVNALITDIQMCPMADLDDATSFFNKTRSTFEKKLNKYKQRYKENEGAVKELQKAETGLKEKTEAAQRLKQRPQRERKARVFEGMSSTEPSRSRSRTKEKETSKKASTSTQKRDRKR